MRKTLPGIQFLLLATILVAIASCSSKSSDPAATAAGGSSSGTINGQAITFNSSKATDTGAGLEIVLGDNSRAVTMNLSDKTAATYIVKNISSGRVNATNEVTVTAVIDNVNYYGVSGSVVTSVGSDGKIAATFSIDLKSSAGLTASIASGKISGVSIGSVPTGCKITSITYSNTKGNCDKMDSYNFFYNSDGKISKAVSSFISLTYAYNTSGKLAGIAGSFSGSGDSGTGNIEFSYAGDVMTSYKVKESVTSGGKTATSTENVVFSYSGKSITSIVNTSTSTGSSASSDTDTFVYTEGNITTRTNRYTCCNNLSGTNAYQFKNYDTKKNPYALLAQLTGSPVSFMYGGLDDFFAFFSLSANNPGTRVDGTASTRTYSYVYNAQNYPTQITYTYEGLGTNSCVDLVTITYSGCQ